MEVTARLAREFLFALPFGGSRRQLPRQAPFQNPLAPTRCPLPPHPAGLFRKGCRLGFFKEMDGPVVLKPTTGSGSELVFCCESVE